MVVGGVIRRCGWRRMSPAMVRREFWIGQDLVENKLWLMHFFLLGIVICDCVKRCKCSLSLNRTHLNH